MTIDAQLRDLFVRQSAALPVPDARPGEAVLHFGGPDRWVRPARHRLLIGAAAAGLIVLGGIALATRGSAERVDPAERPSVAPGTHVDVATPQVHLAASSIVVTGIGGQTFVPPAIAQVHGDPGTASYTTLELDWSERGVPMRINIYFTSDGTSWWATEIRTYDGSVQGEWITTTGVFFRSPLRAAFVGDLNLPSLQIRDMTLTAFAPTGVSQVAPMNNAEAEAIVVANSTVDATATVDTAKTATP